MKSPMMLFLLLGTLLSPMVASKCCLCDDCVKPDDGLVSAEFGSGEVGCHRLNERMIQWDADQDQCKVHIMAHRDNCCGETSKQQLRKLQTGTNNPTCQLCYDNNPPECPGRGIGDLLAKACLCLTGRITTQWCNPLRACFQDWCCSPCPAPTPWTATTPADSPNPPATFSYQSWDETQQRDDDPLQGICYNSPTGSGGGGGPTTDQGSSGGDGGGGFNCFPGDSVVDVLGKGKIYMAHLQIGDRVRTRHDKFTRVYSFAHWDPTVAATFVSIDAGSETLVLSADHMVYANDKVVRASDVKIGDILIGEAQQSLVVSKIGSVQRRGVYAPATESGDLLVSGVLASNYVAVIPGEPTILDQHILSHMLLAPFRMYCRWDFRQCEEETYTVGISDKYLSLVKLVLTSNRWAPSTQFWVSVVALPFIVFLWSCEQVSLEWLTFAIGVLGTWALLRRRNSLTKTNQ